jgi:hypothetical protein
MIPSADLPACDALKRIGVILLAVSLLGCRGFNPLAADASPDLPPGGSDAGCSGLTPASTASTLGAVSNGSLISSLAFTENTVAAAWEDTSAGKKVWLALIEPDGTRSNAPSMVASGSRSPSMAVAPEQGFAIVYHSDGIPGAISLKLFDRRGTELAHRTLASLAGNQGGYPKIVSGGDAFAVAYYDGNDTTGYHVLLGILRRDGTALRPFSVLPSTDKSTALVDLATTESGFAAAWTDERHGDSRIVAARLGPNGDKLPPGDLVLTDGSRASTFPVLASSADALEVCYSADYDGGSNSEIECVHVDAASSVSKPIRITSASGVSSFPKIITTPTRFAVVWGDEGFSFGKILLRQLRFDGSTDGSNIALTDFLATSGYPSVVWLGQGIGLGWYQFAQGSWSFVYQSYPCR